MLEPEVEAAPWDEQLARDDASYRAQLEYVFGRSIFYREKLTAAGCSSARDAGGLAEMSQLPLTETTDELCLFEWSARDYLRVVWRFAPRLVH